MKCFFITIFALLYTSPTSILSCPFENLQLFFKFYFIFKLCIIVLVLPNIKMNPPQVYSSMYFFLSHLSFVDVWFSSNVTLKMLENLLSNKNHFICGGVWCSVTSSQPLSTWKYISWLWWPLITTWPSATLCFMAVKCPGLSVIISSLWRTSMGSLSA